MMIIVLLALALVAITIRTIVVCRCTMITVRRMTRNGVVFSYKYAVVIILKSIATKLNTSKI